MPRQAGNGPSREASPDGLLVTKLRVPRLPAGFVPRQRLIEQLDAGRGGRLTLVCAPAGFGKTALLASWTQRGTSAWLGLDPADNDPVRFCRHVLAALDRVREGIGGAVSPLIESPTPASPETIVTAIVNELAAAPQEESACLVLDDYHVIEAEPVHVSLRYFLEHAPPGVHVTLTSRADPPLPLARLRAHGELAELRAADLRFTTDEAADLLRLSAGPELDDEDVATLTSRTEGWAAGLQLAGLSMRGRPDVKEFVATFSGSHRYVLDYLTEEVLEAQPDSVRDFLLATSVLDRLSGPLCDAITGHSDSQRMLEAIEQANLFLVPLDDLRGWWRYHHLFADLLRSRLQRDTPQEARRLHGAAAKWFADNGFYEDAIRHSVTAGEPDQAGLLIEERFDEIFRAGEHATMRRWLSMLPTDVIHSRPRLCVARAYVGLLTNELDAVDEALAAAEQVPAGDFRPSVGHRASLIAQVDAAIAVLRSMVARVRGDHEATRRLAEQAMLAVGDRARTQRIVARQQLAVALWIGGRLDEAESMLAATVDGWQDSDELVMTAWAVSALCPVRRAQGRLTAAADAYHRLLSLAAVPGRAGRLVAEAISYVGLAEIDYDRGRLDSSREHATLGITRCRQLNYGPLLSTALARLAWIRYVNGDRQGARESIDEAHRSITTHGPTEFTPAPVLRARLLLALGEVDEVARWTRARGLGEADRLEHPREGEYLVLARLLLSRRHPDKATRLLDRLHTAAIAQRRVTSIIEIQVLRALARAASGDDDGASAALLDALSHAHREGHIRVFADEGAPLGELIRRLIAGRRLDEDGSPGAVGVPLGFIGRVAKEFGHADPTSVERGAGGAAPLTDRELDVLRMLAEGKSNKAVADSLYLSPNTVKHHVTHILGKLGAANRTEAVARARRLELIP